MKSGSPFEYASASPVTLQTTTAQAAAMTTLDDFSEIAARLPLTLTIFSHGDRSGRMVTPCDSMKPIRAIYRTDILYVSK
jgi:hypothetical protein